MSSEAKASESFEFNNESEQLRYKIRNSDVPVRSSTPADITCETRTDQCTHYAYANYHLPLLD